MPYCVNCGVELDEKAELCPLCLTPLARKTGKDEGLGGRALAALGSEVKEKLTPAEGQTLVWELLTVSLAIGAAVIAAIDLFLDAPGLSWSPYPLASIGLAWLLMSAILQKRVPRPARLACAALAPPVFFLILDFFDGRLTWSLSIALPVCLAAECAIAILAFAFSRRKGITIVANFLAVTAAFCVAVESILDLTESGKVSLGWSAIVLAALIPISIFLFYLHYRILGTAQVRRFFHF